MKCPYCGRIDDKVIDSRTASDAKSIRRRRECLKCGRRFTTYENIEELSLMVIKKDGRREPFDRNKIVTGIVKACEKRPIPVEKIEEVVDSIERALQKKYDKEVNSSHIGELVMDVLHDLDEVAYVRFASVYRSFKDLNQFMKELRELLSRREK